MIETISIHDRIIALYGEMVLRKSALNIRAGAGVIPWAMQGKGYRTAVEIGTYRGCATAEMAQYCARVVTFDLAHGRLEQNAERWDRDAFWRSLGVHNVGFVPVRDDTEKARWLRNMDFDFAFVDGAHDRASVALDFELVRKCGRVLFHDADDNGPGRANDVFEFLQTLPKDELIYKDIFALWMPKA